MKCIWFLGFHYIVHLSTSSCCDFPHAITSLPLKNPTKTGTGKDTAMQTQVNYFARVLVFLALLCFPFYSANHSITDFILLSSLPSVNNFTTCWGPNNSLHFNEKALFSWYQASQSWEHASPFWCAHSLKPIFHRDSAIYSSFPSASGAAAGLERRPLEKREQQQYGLWIPGTLLYPQGYIKQ